MQWWKISALVPPRQRPKNKLSDSERRAIIDIFRVEELASTPPSRIMPRAANRGKYFASESPFYRILNSVGLLNHRDRDKPRVVWKNRPATQHMRQTTFGIATSATWARRYAASFSIFTWLKIYSTKNRRVTGQRCWKRRANSRVTSADGVIREIYGKRSGVAIG